MTGGFPPSHRLKIKAQFDWVFTRPNERCSHGVLQAIYRPARPILPIDDTLDPAIQAENPAKPSMIAHSADSAPLGPRLGLIIAKRFLPRAVDRNHLKRLIREGFRAQRPELPATDIIVRLMRKPARQVSAGEVAALFGKMHRAESSAQNAASTP